MSVPTISPSDAKCLLDQGAHIIDIRSADEFAREHIPGALNEPADTLTKINGDARQVIFHCKSGQRTQMNASKLSEAAQCETFILDGGLEAWKKAGFPTMIDKTQPIEIQRQVQILAGSLVVLGIVLGEFVAPQFIAISAFIGAGLVFAGISGWCGMAKMLAAMPWNRVNAN